MNELPFFTVVIPTYNRADLIEKTIRSVLSQSFTDFELLVVDDGSTDQTESVVNGINDPRLVYYKKENAERAAARNFGAKHAKGQYVNFFDSDDIAFSNHLQTAFDLIQQKNQPEAFHLAYEWAFPNGEVFKKVNQFSGNINLALTKSNVFSCNGVFVRTDIINQNPFNEDRSLSASEDWELWLRLASKYPIQYTNTITSQIIDHEGRSVSTINKDKLIKRKELFFKYTLENPEVRAFIGKNIRPFKAEAYSYVALHLVLARYKKEGLKYWVKSLKICPMSFFSRRNFAIIKHFIF
jgi:glycosyltransferase involved in cell wall biosynthesis